MAENDRKSTATTVEREAKLVYEEGESASSGIAEAFQLTECERSEVLNSQFRMTLVLRHTHTHTLLSPECWDWQEDIRVQITHAAWDHVPLREEGLSVMLLRLTMRCTQTGLLLPGNLTGRVQILPFVRNTAPLCSRSFFSPVLNITARLSLTGKIFQTLIVV